MSSSPDFVSYLCEQLEGLGAVRSRKMFGEYMVYLDDKPVLMVCDDTPYIKILPCLSGLLEGCSIAPPYEGAKDYYVLDPDDRETLRQAVRLAEEVTLLPKKKAPKTKRPPDVPADGPIPWHLAWPDDRKPEQSDIAAWVETPLFWELTNWLEETYGIVPKVEYSACSMEPGWNVKYKKGAKALCALYPRRGSFACMVTLGRAVMPQAELAIPMCCPETQKLFAAAPDFQGGKWLTFEVTSAEQVADIQMLIQLKVKPPKRGAGT